MDVAHLNAHSNAHSDAHPDDAQSDARDEGGYTHNNNNDKQEPEQQQQQRQTASDERRRHLSAAARPRGRAAREPARSPPEAGSGRSAASVADSGRERHKMQKRSAAPQPGAIRLPALASVAPVGGEAPAPRCSGWLADARSPARSSSPLALSWSLGCRRWRQGKPKKACCQAQFPCVRAEGHSNQTCPLLHSLCATFHPPLSIHFCSGAFTLSQLLDTHTRSKLVPDRSIVGLVPPMTLRQTGACHFWEQRTVSTFTCSSISCSMHLVPIRYFMYLQCYRRRCIFCDSRPDLTDVDADSDASSSGNSSSTSVRTARLDLQMIRQSARHAPPWRPPPPPGRRARARSGERSGLAVETSTPQPSQEENGHPAGPCWAPYRCHLVAVERPTRRLSQNVTPFALGSWGSW